MSVDAKCYECIAGAGLEPILDKHYINSKTSFTLAKEFPKDVLHTFQQDPSVPPSMKEKLGIAIGLKGGRGQASGFIMRMMAENKKKHQGQYKNPSDNDYGSTMNKFAAFDYNKLANAEQSGTNQTDYGASPFIIKHFGSPEAVPFVPKAQRTEPTIEGETEEQKAARLQAKSEQLAQLAKDLLEKSAAKGKIKGFLKGRVLVKKAKELLQQKKAYKTAEDARKAKEEDKKDFEKKASEYAKEVRTEWSKVDKALYDYLSYRYKGEYGASQRRSELRDLMKEFFMRKMEAKFPDFKKRYDKLGYDARSRIIPTTQYDGPSFPYSYKKLTFGEAKKVYDATFPKEEEDLDEEGKAMVEADEAERTRGLKGVIRRIIRTRKNLKAQAGKLALPKWWDGVMGLLDFAKNSSEDHIRNFSWFGKLLYYADRHKGNKYFVKNPVGEIPPEKKETKAFKDAKKAVVEKFNKDKAREPKEWKKFSAEMSASLDKLNKEFYDSDPRSVLIERQSAQYEKSKELLQRLATNYAKWLFTIALPTKGYNLVEYHPSEATFPQVEEMETRMVGGPSAYGSKGYTYHKTGKKRPSGTRMLLGTDERGYKATDTPPPLPDTITLLLHPEGQLAWLISSASGADRWVGLANKMIGDNVSGNTGFSFNVKFKKVGDQFVHIIPDYVDGASRQTTKPQKVGSLDITDTLNSQTLLGFNPPKPSKDHISWAYDEGIAQITKNLFDDLCERKAWSGEPLDSIDLTGAGRKRR